MDTAAEKARARRKPIQEGIHRQSGFADHDLIDEPVWRALRTAQHLECI